MGRPKRRYVCQACGSLSHRWQGQCADCGEWNSLVEEAPETVFSARHDLSSGGRGIVFEPLDKPGELLAFFGATPVDPNNVAIHGPSPSVLPGQGSQ